MAKTLLDRYERQRETEGRAHLDAVGDASENAPDPPAPVRGPARSRRAAAAAPGA